MAHSARVAGAALVAALVAIAGAARAEIDPLAPTLDTTTPAGLDDESTCLAAGGSWVVAPPHCEVDLKATEDLGWDWSTFGEAAAERSDKAAAAWRGYIEGRLKARKLNTTSFLLTTAAFVARVDASLARLGARGQPGRPPPGPPKPTLWIVSRKIRAPRSGSPRELARS